MARPITVGILLFNEVEVLDFAGPFEVFSLAQACDGTNPFTVKTLSQDGGMATACNGLKVQPDYSFENAPYFDIIIVPGGYGARIVEVRNPAVLEWLKARNATAEIMASVCTGSFLLAEAGLLNGIAATTHWAHTDEFARQYPAVEVRPNVKFVDQGRILTSGGISAGINMSFHIVKRLIGRQQALDTARAMEYDIVL